jgi:predicted negative regulator of RcsB-dependent stress response
MKVAVDEPELKKNKKSFFREWGVLIVFGVGMITLIVGYRFWTEYQANQPILPVYATYLDYLADGSAKARAVRDKYYVVYGRTTVASQHFVGMCRAMQKSAVSEGIDAAKYSKEFAFACASDPFGGSILDGLPQVEATTGKESPAKNSAR